VHLPVTARPYNDSRLEIEVENLEDSPMILRAQTDPEKSLDQPGVSGA
jgi:hypothetical protein